MTWEGYNDEDAVRINEKIFRDDVYTSIHIEEYETEARDTKLGPEEITCDIPNVNEDLLKDQMCIRDRYHNPCAKGEEKKVPELVEQLFDFFMNNPQRLPDQMQLIAYQEGLVRAVCDHVAGMTDHFAVQTFTSIYIPNSWTS